MSLAAAGVHNKARLRLSLLLFFLALAIPTAVLVEQAYSRLKWESLHQYRQLADELSRRIDSRLDELITTQEAHTFSDYSFLVLEGEPSANFVQRSPLSNFPVNRSIPGLIGYFQVDDQGYLSTPLLPDIGQAPSEYGLSDSEVRQRQTLVTQIQEILVRNQLVADTKPAAVEKDVVAVGAASDLSFADAPAEAQPAPVASPSASQMYSAGSRRVKAEESLVAKEKMTSQVLERLGAQLSAPTRGGAKQMRVEDLQLDDRYQQQATEAKADLYQEARKSRADKRMARTELEALPVVAPAPQAEESRARSAAVDEVRVSMFASEIDPFELNMLDSGHFVLYRKVWREGERFVQGALLSIDGFLQGLVENAFRDSALSLMSELIVSYRGNVLEVYSGRLEQDYLSSAEDLGGALLYQTRLSAPAGELELLFTLNSLPPVPGSAVVFWTAAILAAVLLGGFYFIYRLGVGQIELARQQQDFISAVSHELKTPLTSIRMYGEMLREGWVSEEKKRNCYEYIHDESERLSRLINNVLQLARMTRRELDLDLKLVTVAEAIDLVQSKIATPVERAGFALHVDCQPEVRHLQVRLDTDCFIQIFINLVDNAIKFSRQAQRKDIAVTCCLISAKDVQFAVRDYGPGVAHDQMKKIFQLFYRPENELTRDTTGTGIGLALVRQLAHAMGGRVDLRNRVPGTEASVSFPMAGDSVL